MPNVVTQLRDRARVQPGEWVLVIQGMIFVACVLLFRRGVVGEVKLRTGPLDDLVALGLQAGGNRRSGHTPVTRNENTIAEFHACLSSSMLW